MGANRDKEPQADVFESVKDFIWRHPAVALTLMYLYTSFLGVMYSWTLVGQFGINIMDFAAVEDFLLAALRQPASLLQSLGAAALAVFAVGMRARRRRGIREAVCTTPPATDEELAEKLAQISWLVSTHMAWTIAAVVLSAYSLVPPLVVGRLQADRLKRGEGLAVLVEVKDNCDSGHLSCEEGAFVLISATNKFHFFYDHAERQTHIILTDSILGMLQLPEGSTRPCSSPTPTRRSTLTPLATPHPIFRSTASPTTDP